MRVAAYANASALLVSDIDRGGAFAHLYGTHQILPPEWRGLISGFVLSKFRGDPALLAPGPKMLEQLTGVPTVALVPMLQHTLPTEEGPSLALARQRVSGLRVQVVCPPYASNLDEFTQLQQRTDFRWVRSPEELDAPDLVILPGSKNTMAGLAWLHERGLAARIDELHQQGVQVKLSTRPSSACRWRSWPASIQAGWPRWKPVFPSRPPARRVLPPRLA